MRVVKTSPSGDISDASASSVCRLMNGVCESTLHGFRKLRNKRREHPRNIDAEIALDRPPISGQIWIVTLLVSFFCRCVSSLAFRAFLARRFRVTFILRVTVFGITIYPPCSVRLFTSPRLNLPKEKLISVSCTEKIFQ